MAGSEVTKHALAMALKDIMEELPFQKISVVDICEKCGMNRKSFYYHFKDKYELVNWIFFREFIVPHKDLDYEIGWPLLSELCDYFYKNKSFYKNVMSVDGQNSFREYLTEIFSPIASEYLRDIMPHNSYEDMTTRYFVAAMLIAIISWLNSKDDVPGDVFFSLVKNSIIGFSKHIVDEQKLDKKDKSCEE